MMNILTEITENLPHEFKMATGVAVCYIIFCLRIELIRTSNFRTSSLLSIIFSKVKRFVVSRELFLCFVCVRLLAT
jgi:hypothetical protein